MAVLTDNLFEGQGERDHRLGVVAGEWPTDVEGAVYVVGPDKRRPGGHWFGAPGLLERISMVPDSHGRIAVSHRVIDTPVARWRRRVGFAFGRVGFVELSPFGVTNLANTNVGAVDGRLFVGYDAGRPVEVDPVTLGFVTPVGGNDEWLQSAPGVLEPLCAVAAHPATDVDEGALYFVNYGLVGLPGDDKEVWLARWDLDGPVRRWRVAGTSPFDSIHDVKVTEHHVVFSDLPFVVEPDTFAGAARTIRAQGHTTLWIVAKSDLAATPPGGEVSATEVRIPMPTGHLFVDRDEVDGCIRVVLQQIPLSDLMLTLGPEHGGHEGLVALAVQPSVVGRYLVEPTTGQVRSAAQAVDVDRVWGGVLATTDTHRAGARAHQRQLWHAGVGFDPGLVPAAWWDLYGDATDGVVAPGDLPVDPVAATLSRVDLDAMEVVEVWAFGDGAFASPPTFVPRAGSDEPDDGYVVVVVHRDGDKEVQVFDALRVEAGPVARATAAGFNPGLLLHSCWMPDRVGPRPSAYAVPVGRDVRGALAGVPGVVARTVRMARAVARQRATARSRPGSGR